MDRQMCVACPFDPKSKTAKHLEDWMIELNQYQLENEHCRGLPQGCHMIDEAQHGDGSLYGPFQPNPELQCIGHLRLLEQNNGDSL